MKMNLQLRHFTAERRLYTQYTQHLFAANIVKRDINAKPAEMQLRISSELKVNHAIALNHDCKEVILYKTNVLRDKDTGSH